VEAFLLDILDAFDILGLLIGAIALVVCLHSWMLSPVGCPRLLGLVYLSACTLGCPCLLGCSCPCTYSNRRLCLFRVRCHLGRPRLPPAFAQSRTCFFRALSLARERLIRDVPGGAELEARIGSFSRVASEGFNDRTLPWSQAVLSRCPASKSAGWVVALARGRGAGVSEQGGEFAEPCVKTSE
jgi:hypothetical protein